MGFVFKRGAVWYIRYDLPPHADGRRNEKWKSCKGLTRAEAKARLAAIEVAVASGAHVEPATTTLSGYLNRWIQYSESRLAPASLRRYRSYAEIHVGPAIGHIRLDRLRPMALQQCLDDLVRVSGLSAKTGHDIYAFLHAALRQAVRWQSLATNPADAVTPPRPRRTQHDAPGADEVRRIIEAAEGSRLRIPILLVVATGMRKGEALGLRWEDFDAKRHILTVRRSICQLPGQVFAKEPKTGRFRSVLISPSLCRILGEHRSDQARRRAEYGEMYEESAYICTRANGALITPNALGQGFRHVAKAAGSAATLHSLRHTQATELLLAGVPAKVVSERLGHATINITQDLYAHVLPQQQGAAVEVIEGIMQPRITLLDGGTEDQAQEE